MVGFTAAPGVVESTLGRAQLDADAGAEDLRAGFGLPRSVTAGIVGGAGVSPPDPSTTPVAAAVFVATTTGAAAGAGAATATATAGTMGVDVVSSVARATAVGDIPSGRWASGSAKATASAPMGFGGFCADSSSPPTYEAAPAFAGRTGFGDVGFFGGETSAKGSVAGPPPPPCRVE